MKKIISFTLLIIILTLLIQTPIKSNFQSNNITSQEKELTLTITDIQEGKKVAYIAEHINGKQFIFTQEHTTDTLEKGDLVTVYLQYDNEVITVFKE
jgi:uncharacterized membrane protein